MDRDAIINSIKINKQDDENIEVLFHGDAIPVSKSRELRFVAKHILKQFPDFICSEDGDTMENIGFSGKSATYNFKKIE